MNIGEYYSEHPFAEVYIASDPVAKERARLKKTRRVGEKSAYTPTRTKEFEKVVGWCARWAMRGKDMADGPVSVNLLVGIEPPRKWTSEMRRLLSEMPFFHTRDPDADNIAKSVLDGCTGIIWKDDNVVADLTIVKIWHEKPFVALDVYDLPDFQSIYTDDAEGLCAFIQDLNQRGNPFHQVMANIQSFEETPLAQAMRKRNGFH